MRSLLSILVLLLGCGGSTGPASVPASSPSPLLGAPLPDLGRVTLNLGGFDRAALRDRVIVVEFFASYCQPCQRTLPVAQSLHQQGAALVIGVNEDDEADAAWGQIRHHGLTFPVIHDGSHMVAGRFRVSQMPISFVADRQGHIVWVGGPGHDPAELRRAVAAAGAQPAASPPPDGLQ